MKISFISAIILVALLAGGILLFQKLYQPEKPKPETTSQSGKVSTIANLAQPDPKLENTPNSPYSYSAQIDSNTQALFAEKDSTKPSYEIKQGDYSLKFTLNTPEVGSDSSGVKGVKTSDNIIEYAVNIQGIPMTLRHTTTSNGVKEEFIIAKKPDNLNIENCDIENSLKIDPPAGRCELKIPFTMENKGLKVKDDGQGKYTFTDSKGETIWTIEPPTLIDAKGKTGVITASLSHNTYYLILNTDFLLQATYPVVIDPTVIINTSSTTLATAPSSMRHIVRTSDGTLHAFIQMGTNTATCGSGGLWWIYSTDNFATAPTCGGQLSSDTTNLMYADARVDSSDNIYTVYSVVANGANAAYNVFYRKLTKGAGSTWTLEAAQTVLDGITPATSCATVNTGSYSYTVLELEGTTRLWLATRCYDGTNYQVSVYYSDGLGTAPTWTQSVATLDTAGTGVLHLPILVRFGSKIGVIFTMNSGNALNWRYRVDGEGLTSWAKESEVVNDGNTAAAVGDSSGHIYVLGTRGGSLFFSYYNGSVWLSRVSTWSSNVSGNSITISTDGTNVWIFNGESAGLSTSLSGAGKLSYRKGTPPFTSSDFSSATAVASYHGVFDKAWSFVASAYTDITTAAGDTTSADTQMVTSSGDIAYFGKSTTFDAISWDLSTLGNSGGAITWEYCSAVDGSTACTTWSTLTFASQTSAAASDFEADGYGAFTVPGDWVAAKVNSESTAYYYIRARATASYTTSPVGVQMAAIPAIYSANVTSTVAGSTIHAIWTENAVSPTKVRYIGISATASTTPAATAGIPPNTIAYSSSTLATQPSAMRHIVRTSDGTLHAFIQGGTQMTCGGATGSNNVGLNWLYSTDLGSTWTCGGQLSSDTTNLMYADARVDSSDNIYVVYSVAAGSASAAYNVSYRRFTKGSGSTWTMEAAQTVLDGITPATSCATVDTGSYSYAVIEPEGSTRLWLATRCFDGTNYQVSVFYSDGLGTAPTWTQSVAVVDTGKTGTTAYHTPTIVRYGSKIGVFFETQDNPYNLWWSNRADSDDLSSWSAPSQVGTMAVGSARARGLLSTVSTVSGNIFVISNDTAGNVYYSSWNESSWSTRASLGTNIAQRGQLTITTDGTNVWAIYGSTTGLSSSLSGSAKLVYKKGVYNSSSNTTTFDSTATAVIPYHGIFDKVWTYISSSYSDVTTAAGNTTSADVTMPSAAADIIYFGKTAKFDAISFDLSTLGIGGLVVWEYYNGSTWMPLTTYFAVSNNNFITGDGYITFNPHSDWATTQINSEATAYYYVRARVTTTYTTAPVGVQMAAIPQINWANVAATTAGIYAIWTENAASPTRIRYAAIPIHFVRFNGVRMNGIQVK